MNNNNKEIIDFGEINVPQSWNEVSLRKFQDLKKVYNHNEDDYDIRKIISVLTNKSEEEINEYPIEFLEIIMDKLKFLTEETPKESKNSIIINDEEYSINYKNKLRVGEYVAFEMVLKNDADNYAAMLGILCRKKDEKYDSKFENEVLEDRIKMFEEQPITKILPMVNFFIERYMTYMIPMQLSMEVENAIDQSARTIQTLRQNGVLSKSSTRHHLKTLKKLKKSIKNI